MIDMIKDMWGFDFLMHIKEIVYRMRSYLLIIVLLLPMQAMAGEIVSIGVLAKEGKDKTLRMWESLGTYLTTSIRGQYFKIVPLTFEEVETAVRDESIDFAIINPFIYIYLEDKYKISRMVTVNKRQGDKAHTTLGSVIFSRKDRLHLDSIQLLNDKRVAAVNGMSLGGWQIARDSLQRHGFDADNAFSSLVFLNTHDAVVDAVSRGDIDVGIVRTNTLERLDKLGEISLEDFSVLVVDEDISDHQRLVSTKLYPEWPFAKLEHTSDRLSVQVASALLRMNENDIAAKRADIVGWYMPYNYTQIKELLKRLKLPPYDKKAELSFVDFVMEHKLLFIISCIALAFLFLMLLRQRALMQSLVNEVKQRKKMQLELDNTNQVLVCLDKIRKMYIQERDPFKLFPYFLDQFLTLTESDIGYIADVLHDDKDNAYLKIYSVSDLSRDVQADALYKQCLTEGMEIHNLNNLLGGPITLGEAIISNDPISDPRGDGFPYGHSTINNFIGIPIFYGAKVVGTMGLANRKAGYDQDFLQWLAPVLAGLGHIIVARWNSVAREENERELEELVLKDSLTGIYNRRIFQEVFDGQLQRLNRYGERSTLLLLDIDYFKKVNDLYGHDVGDQVLIETVELINSIIRDIDIFIRWGGEEFLILLPQTNTEQGIGLAQRLCTEIAERNTTPEKRVTISIGITAVTIADSADSAVIRADKALYNAKESGRNCVMSCI